AKFQKGWNSYDAEPPSSTAIDAAMNYLSLLQRTALEPARVEASVMGGIGVTHRRENRKVYVEFYNKGNVHALFSDRTPAMVTEAITPDVDGYLSLIEKARAYLNG